MSGCHVGSSGHVHIFQSPYVAVGDGCDLRVNSFTLTSESLLHSNRLRNVPDITVELVGPSPWCVGEPVTVHLHRNDDTVTEYSCAVTEVYPENPQQGTDYIELGGETVVTREDEWELVGGVGDPLEPVEPDRDDELSSYTGGSR